MTRKRPMLSAPNPHPHHEPDSMSDAAASSRSGFQFVTHWQREDAENADAVHAFWQHENAIDGAHRTQRRLREVILDARTQSGEIAGVCTTVPVTPPRLAEPMYYYRCFIGSPWRKTRLVYDMLNRAFEVLERHAIEHDYPCIGVMLELENTKFDSNLRRPVWTHTRFIYIGKSARNLDLRVRYFHGAHLGGNAKS